MARPTEVSRRDCQGCNASGFPAAFQSPAEIRGDLWAGLFSLPRSLPYVTDLSLFGLLSGEGVRAFTSCISNSSFAWSCRTGLGWRRSLQARHAMQSKAKSPSTPTAAMTPPSTMSDGGGGESGEGGRRYTSSSFGSDARKRVDRSGESATPSGCVPLMRWTARTWGQARGQGTLVGWRAQDPIPLSRTRRAKDGRPGAWPSRVTSTRRRDSWERRRRTRCRGANHAPARSLTCLPSTDGASKRSATAPVVRLSATTRMGHFSCGSRVGRLRSRSRRFPRAATGVRRCGG